MAETGRDVSFDLNGSTVSTVDRGESLLEVLRDRLGVRSVKDGCSPQGQCGCCTVLVDGQPRVSCVTPVRRIAGRTVTTVEGLGDSEAWAGRFCDAGASQCGFCTPGIIVRLAGAEARHGPLDSARVLDSLKAHLCRCTGWQTIVEAATGSGPAPSSRDMAAAEARAAIEGGVSQAVDPAVALGRGVFADDAHPDDALVAVLGPGGDWFVGETVSEARAAAGKIQGRRTTVAAAPPVPLPEGDWVAALQTSWVDPAYLETDASWCSPGGEPVEVLGNGGAFGGKETSEVAEVARRLADRHGRPVRALYSREDAIERGPKRPPFAGGVREDGSGVAVFARTVGVSRLVRDRFPAFEVDEIDVVGPPTSLALRGAGWVEVAVLASALAPAGPVTITTPDGAVAEALVDDDGIHVDVSCGRVLDEVVLRSYCIGAAHMAYSWVTSESIAVDESGGIHDLTVRSLGVVRAADTPPIHVSVTAGDGESVRGGDAVFAAVAAATWRAGGLPPVWPTG
jgi:aerobic-type carbon monoxide dehydrogenase small subunit (CoxS/CutS family)